MSYITIDGNEYYVSPVVKAKFDELTNALELASIPKYALNTLMSQEESETRKKISGWVSCNVCDGDPDIKKTKLNIDADEVSEMIGDCVEYLVMGN